MTDGLQINVKSEEDFPMVEDAMRKYLEKFGKIIVNVIDARRRSDLQNRLMHALYREIGKQLYGKDEEFAKCECKLTIGVPLLRETNEDFKKIYDFNLKKLDYEAKLQVISVINVTSILNMGAAHQYIEKIYDDYAQKGVNWTDFINKSRDALNA